MAEFAEFDLDELMEALSDISFYLRRIDRRLEALPHDIAHKMGYQPQSFSANNLWNDGKDAPQSEEPFSASNTEKQTDKD